jgi:hypothetical protein
MNTNTETSTLALLANEPGYDLLEDRLRLNIRATIEAVFEEELQTFLGRCRYVRGGEGAKGHRNGHRSRQIIGTFGAETVQVPRVRILDGDGQSSEWRSKALPRYQRLTRKIYLIGLAAGSTNAFFLDDLGNELLRPEILVQLDIVSTNQALKVLLPDTDIKITAVKSHLFLTGNVRSAGISEIAQIVASRFVADKANVINMLVVIEDQLGEPKSKSAPSPAIAPVVVGEPKNETRSVTIYRAAAPSTIVIKK